MDIAPAAKKAKIDGAQTTIPEEVSTSTAIVPVGKATDAGTSSAATQANNQLLPKPIERLALTVNPTYLQRLKAANVLGYERQIDARFSDPRFYEIEISNFRNAMTAVLSAYLKWKYHELGKMPSAKITAEINTITPICVNACMTALYAKLRNIHKQYGTYATRYGTPPTYAKEIELPLPFADAIQNFGVFETRCLEKNYIFIPVYPEGTKHEGRSTEDWNSYKYEACMPFLKECGIPLKSVDTRLKFGSAWWTYKVARVHDSFDFQCILPSLHYTNHSAVLSSLFVLEDSETHAPIPIIKHKTEDGNYGYILREMVVGFQLRSFSALCHAVNQEWNYTANID